jgi:diamine N-acetyltransferase
MSVTSYSLRPVHDDDHEWLVDLHNDPVVLRNVTHPNPITLERHLRWWGLIVQASSQQRLIFTVDGIRAGFAKFYDVDYDNGCCVLGGDIHKDYRGMGLAKVMWRLMLDTCFNGMNLHRVSLTSAEYNAVGLHVYRGLGFKEEGRMTQALCRDGRRWDQICMYMLREDWLTRG